MVIIRLGHYSRRGVWYIIYKNEKDCQEGRKYENGIAPSRAFLFERVKRDFRVSSKEIKTI